MAKTILVVLLVALTGSLALGGADDSKREYLEKAKALKADDVKGHYLLGLWCEKNVLRAEARLEFERVIACESDHAGARRALGYVKHGKRWLTGDEAMRAKGLVKHEGTWLLSEEVEALLLPAKVKARRKRAQQKARKLLKSMVSKDAKVQRIAMKALDGIDDRDKVEPLAFALRYPAENVRTYAAKELGRIKDRRALRPLIYRSIIDPSKPVREQAMASVKAYDDPNLLSPYVNAMFSDNSALSTNAVRAVGALGDVHGIEYLIYKLRAHGGGVSRNHIYLANQLSFIQDFDVEVAQTAFIADPIVGIIQEGVSLDVRVLATERDAILIERRAIRSSLAKLAGKDLGNDAKVWAKWWKDNKKELLAKK